MIKKNSKIKYLLIVSLLSGCLFANNDNDNKEDASEQREVDVREKYSPQVKACLRRLARHKRKMLAKKERHGTKQIDLYDDYGPYDDGVPLK